MRVGGVRGGGLLFMGTGGGVEGCARGTRAGALLETRESANLRRGVWFEESALMQINKY